MQRQSFPNVFHNHTTVVKQLLEMIASDETDVHLDSVLNVARVIDATAVN